VSVAEHNPFGGPLVIRVGAEEQVIGQELARQILCRRVSP